MFVKMCNSWQVSKPIASAFMSVWNLLPDKAFTVYSSYKAKIDGSKQWYIQSQQDKILYSETIKLMHTGYWYRKSYNGQVQEKLLIVCTNYAAPWTRILFKSCQFVKGCLERPTSLTVGLLWWCEEKCRSLIMSA